jgi:hypothetical protein
VVVLKPKRRLSRGRYLARVVVRDGVGARRTIKRRFHIR